MDIVVKYVSESIHKLFVAVNDRRVVLLHPAKGQSNYINAVVVPVRSQTLHIYSNILSLHQDYALRYCNIRQEVMI